MTAAEKPSTGPLYLAIDQGGHSSRAIVFDQHGQTISSAQASIETQYPETGWVEHDPEALVDSIQSVLDQTIDLLGERLCDLHSTGLATQRSSIVCWDKVTGEALSPVISWQDRRNAALIDKLAGEERLDKVQSLTGLRLSPHYGASKIRWCLDNITSVKKANKDQRLVCGPLASFILFRILQEKPLLVDPANASRTLLWDQHSHDWSAHLLDLFAIPENVLPVCTASRSNYGHILLKHSRDSSELKLPVTVMTGDQSAAIYAYGQPQASTVFINMGTGAFLQRVIGTQPIKTTKLLCSTVWKDKESTYYVMEGTVNGAGSAISNMMNALQLDHNKVIDQADNWLENIDSCLLFLNGTGGLGSPWWIADFPAQFIRSETPHLLDVPATAEQKIVAVLESIIFLINRNLLEMQSNLTGIEKVILTGGLSNLDGLCQRLADLSGLTVTRPASTEATARGLAFLLAQNQHWESVAQAAFIPVPNVHLLKRYNNWCLKMDNLIQSA